MANPLFLLRALHSGLKKCGADIITGVDITAIEHDAAAGRFATRYDRCPKVFLSAITLAASVMFWL